MKINEFNNYKHHENHSNLRLYVDLRCIACSVVDRLSKRWRCMCSAYGSCLKY